MNKSVRLWPSGRLVTWSRQGIVLALPGDASLAIPWSQLQAPRLGWGTLSLASRADRQSPVAPEVYRLGWLWPWQAWRLYRSWQQVWLGEQLADLQRDLQPLKQQLKQRYLRAEQAVALQARAEALATQYQPLAGYSLPTRSQQALAWLQGLATATQSDRDQLRARYLRQQLKLYQPLFETIAGQPLTPRQREACILDESATLILAGAGSGKTSVLVARAAYLLASGQAQPHEILLLAYGKQAAEEMAARLAAQRAGVKIEATTFHGLGLRILGGEGRRRQLSPLATDPASRRGWVAECMTALWRDAGYLRLSLDYLCRYLYPRIDPMMFESAQALHSRLAAESLRSFKGEALPTPGEVEIANWLFVNGIEYCYQVAAPASVPAAVGHGGGFYLPEWQLWIEFYLLDKAGKSPVWLASSQYRELPARQAQCYAGQHHAYLPLFHWQWAQGSLGEALAQGLAELGYQWHPLPDEAVLATLGEMGRLAEWIAQLDELLGHYKAGCFDAQRLKRQLDQSADPKRARAALRLLRPLYRAYQARLQTRQELDFDDMIGLALQRVELGEFSSPWRYILVDEFQDISEPRARLLRQLRATHADCSLFCVGDDWQAIYRFTGADLSLTTRFADYFGDSAQLALDRTFRFNDSIAQLANRFIQQDPALLAKSLATSKPAMTDAIILLPQKTGRRQARPDYCEYESIFRQIVAERDPGGEPIASVYLLARFRFTLPGEEQLARWQREYPQLQIQAMTIHSAKGKEAEYVLVAGLSCGEFGLPSEKATHPLLDALLPAQESYPHAEERRLFYVALTRAQKQLFLLADPQRCSPFIQELLAEGYVLQQKAWPQSQASARARVPAAPSPGSTSIPKAQSRLQAAACRHCAMTLQRRGRYQVCAGCGHWEPVCPKCGGVLIQRQGGRGPFWGCRNYRGSEAGSCHHSESQIAAPIG